MPVLTKQFISVGSWNIQGMFQDVGGKRICKLEYQEVEKSIRENDITCLLETHCSYDDELCIEGYKIIPHIRPKSKGAKKHYGGMAICIREELRPGVKCIKQDDPDIMWLKICGKFFKMEKDIYICVAYISPESSAYLKARADLFEIIGRDIQYFSTKGWCMLCGDLNGYTGQSPDFIANDSRGRTYIPVPDGYIMDQFQIRTNSDSRKENKHGAKILELCRTNCMRILNGRCFGDLSGRFTHYPLIDNPSVIDYIITDTDLINRVNQFSVSDLLDCSDHCKVSVYIKVEFELTQDKQLNTAVLKDIPMQFKWESGDSDKFMAACISNEVNSLTQDFLSNNGTNDVNQAVNDFSSILYKACEVAGIRKRGPGKAISKNKRARHKKWFDRDCTSMKKDLRFLARKKQQNPFDISIRMRFYSTYKKYRSLLWKKKNQFHSKIVDKMNECYERSPQAYWKAVKEISEFCKERPEDPIPVDKWIAHFKQLMGSANNEEGDSFMHNIKEFVTNRTQSFNELDFRITKAEVIKATGKLKRGKAACGDGILNEMLKDMSPLMIDAVTKLFNCIFTHGLFPDSWRLNYLTTAHKKGSKLECNNYRGLAVGSNLCKLFCMVLNNRIYEFVVKHKILPVHQIGFKKKCRTTDHIFTLKCLIDKYIKKAGGRLYACFVDLTKAYDTVWRDGLFYKLIKCGISGKAVNILTDMYRSVSFCVKTKGKVTNPFPSEIGLKQGCSLSPLLFNIYMNDLPDVFTQECNPVNIANEAVSLLMFADDVVLLSSDASGLQICLNKLSDYCAKWKLSISKQKTKVMIFNKPGRSYALKFKFYVDGTEIDIVSEYCYLGVIFQPSGLFNKAQDYLYMKATKARSFLFKMLANQNVSVPVAIHLFNTLISPILSYASEVILPMSIVNLKESKLYKLFENLKLEKCHTAFCKFVLGVPSRATNAAVKGELGVFPLAIKMCIHALKFLNRLQSMESDSLVSMSFNDVLALDLPWYKSCCNILKIATPGIQLPVVIDKLKGLYGCIKNKLQDIYVKTWTDIINRKPTSPGNGNKLRIYNKFKSDFVMEHYLRCIMDKHTRSELCKLRISAHNLMVERLRYMPNKPDVDKRFCKFCPTQADTEFHFLLECTKNKEDRQIMIEKIQDIFPQFDTLSDNVKFIKLMQCNDSEVALIVGQFVKSSVSGRRAAS